MKRLKLPVGIESFAEMRQEGFYYIDKTGLIRDLLNNWGKVNLFTRDVYKRQSVKDTLRSRTPANCVQEMFVIFIYFLSFSDFKSSYAS